MTDTSTPRRSPRLTDDEIWDFVTQAHTGTMTTLRRDGMPISLPLWYVVVDRTIYTNTRGKKLLRLAHDPRASFLVETGSLWAELVGVHFTGTATVAEPDDELLARIQEQNETKYATSRPAHMPSSSQLVYSTTMRWVRFVPDSRVLSWSNAKLLG